MTADRTRVIRSKAKDLLEYPSTALGMTAKRNRVILSKVVPKACEAKDHFLMVYSRSRIRAM